MSDDHSKKTLPKVLIYGLKDSQKRFIDDHFRRRLEICHIDGKGRIKNVVLNNYALVIQTVFCSHCVQDTIKLTIDKTKTKLIYTPNGTSGIKNIISEHFNF